MNQIDLRLAAGWVALVAGVSALVVLFAGWAPLVLLAMVGVAFLALSLFHATVTTFVALPFLFHETAPFTDGLFAGLLLLLAVAWCSRLLLQPDRIRFPLSYVVLYLAFLSAIGLSCVFGIDWSLYVPLADWATTRTEFWKRLGITVISIFILSALDDWRQVRVLQWTLVLSGIVYSVPLYFVQQQLPTSPGDVLRPVGLFSQVHAAGLYEVTYFWIALGLFQTEETRWRRAVLLLCLGTFLVSAFYVRSITALAGLAIPLIPVVLSLIRRGNVWYLYLVAALTVVPALSLAARLAAPTVPWQGRIALIKIGLTLFSEHPLVGVGWASHPLLIPPSQIPIGFPALIHTYYATLLAEIGLVGFAIFVAIVAITVADLAHVIRIGRRKGDTVVYHAGVSFLRILIAVLVMFLTEADNGKEILWAVVGLAPGLKYIAGQDRSA